MFSVFYDILERFLIGNFLYNKITLAMVIQTSDILLADNLDQLLASAEQDMSYIVMLYCRQGRLQLSIDGVTHEVHPNDLLCCVASSLAEHMRTPDFECGVISCTWQFFDKTALECFHMEPHWLEKQTYMKTHPVVSLTEVQVQLMTSYFSLLRVDITCQQDAYRKHIIRCLAQSVTLEFLSYLDEAIATEENLNYPHETLSKVDGLMMRFMELIRKSDTRHEVTWYAEQLCVTPKYLSRVCKQRSGKTASDWIDEITIARIRRLLLQTDKNVKEIAFLCGFSNVSFFCQYVKSHTGKTPIQLRTTS